MSAGNDAADNANKQLRRILIIAYGRAADADSRVASALLEKLRERSISDSWWLTLIQDDALRLEHALDLRPNDLAIFIDTHLHGKAPFEFIEITDDGKAPILPEADAVIPGDILHALATLGRNRTLPPSFLLTLPMPRDESKGDIAPDIDASITYAVDFLENLLGDTSNEHWRSETNG
ncbi:homospermidine synthase [Congregibacter litoralis]|uniref:Ni,Fe-hydrogenase maturation factor n=1 Tax=Congregibacter litoralis KT71 TaxID=314285 RepID=A4ABE9_9GAMM|nr:homospermidine synthase [Congregibacter litoralis]EAQ96703.1 Ni,Fe-hydrogenase maturation factor [Congregibacter litoralis KT71]